MSDTGAHTPAVTYVTSRWGTPTQTFVRREAECLADLGVEVSVLSIKRPLGGQDHVCHLRPAAIAVGCLSAIARRPIGTLRILASCRRCTLRNLIPMLAATLIGLAWSGRGLVTQHLHSHFGWVSAASARAAALHAGTTYSVVYHAFEIHTEHLVDDFARTVAADSTVNFTISEKDRRLFSARFAAPATVLRMGVDSQWLRVPARETGTRTVLSVGSLVPKKGHRFLIQAVAQLEGWKLAIVGDGEQRRELQELIDSLDLSDRVALLGQRTEEEVARLMREADIFALACVEEPSGNRDGIPVAIMEAMAMGLPVVTTDAGAIEELVRNVGVIVGQENVSDLAHALAGLQDVDERMRLGRLGHERVRAGWTADRGARRVRELLPL